MKTIQIISITFCLLLAVMSFKQKDSEKQTIYEGNSVGQLQIGMTKTQVDSILQMTPEKIEWTNHSFEYKYKKKGLSVYVLQNDTAQRVFSITVFPEKWKGTTSKGLKVNKKLKIKDVIKVYGEPKWGFTTDCSELDAEYYDIAIYFSVDTISGICDETEFNLDSLYLNKKVTELTIGKIGTDY